MNTEREFKFFTKVRQQSFIAKKIAQSCETLDQLDNTAHWMVSLKENWLRELDDWTNKMGLESLEIYKRFENEYEYIYKEWDYIIKSKQKEISPSEEEPKPKPHFVVTGF